MKTFQSLSPFPTDQLKQVAESSENSLPLKIDMHIHTKYSQDAYITPKELAIYSKKQGLNGVAITDHDTVNGLVEFIKMKNLLKIIW